MPSRGNNKLLLLTHSWESKLTLIENQIILDINLAFFVVVVKVVIQTKNKTVKTVFSYPLSRWKC